MVVSLPDINGKSHTQPAPAEDERRQRDQWRTVHRVCGSAVSHDGYLRMLQGVRQNFLQRAKYNPKEQLPLIMHPKQLSEGSVVDDAGASRFSQGLRFKTEGSHIKTRATSLVEPQQPLCVLEEEERRHLMDTELWERQVLNQMMVVSYVTFVLREELDELHFCECEKRANILYDEEKKRYWLQNESGASKELVRFKSALRAKEEKKRRLEEADVLYPMNSSALPRYVCRPPQEPDARNILQRYVRLKHGATSTTSAAAHSSDRQNPPRSEEEERQRELSPLLLQPFQATRSMLRNTVRNTLGIAAYVALLEKDLQARGIIEDCEQKEFQSILSLFEEHRFLIQMWRNKHMHLKRLLYWQGQREERRQQVQLALEQLAMTAKPRIASECAELVVQEEEGYERICLEESTCRDMWRKLYDKASIEAKLGAILNEQERSRASLEEDEIIARQLWMQQLELALRVSLTLEYETVMSTVMPSQIAVLQFLQKQQTEHAEQIVTIQHALQRWKEGRLGWRYTHREVGRSIQATRDARKIQRGVESMRSFKLSLLADCRAVEEELRLLHEAERVAACEKEVMHRAVINSQEEWEVTALFHERRHRFLEDILLPKQAQYIKEEMDHRREVDVREDFERSRFCCIFYRVLNIMKQKRLLREHEESERVLTTIEEAAAFCRILDEELDNREDLRIATMERERQQEEELRALGASLLEIRRQHQQAHVEKIAQLWIRCKAGALELGAVDPSPRNELLKKFLAGRLHLLEEAALQLHEACTATLQREHNNLIHTIHVSLLVGSEVVARCRLVQTQQDAVAEIVNDMHDKTDAKLRQLQTETKSANVIKHFFRRYRNGEVGRTGMRSFLRDAFAEKREKLQLKQAYQSQREDIQRCRDELEKEVQIARLEKQKTIELKIHILENKTERRERANVENMEQMVFNMILRNHHMGNFAAKADPVAVLWQLELYGRLSITREWQMGFQRVLEPQKSNFFFDINACKIQRFWRRYWVCKQRKLFTIACMEQLQRDEARDRAQLEVLEMDGRVCDLLKPMEGCALLRGYLLNDVPFFLARLCFDIALEVGIYEDEWRNRMLLLWRMRHSFFENAVAKKETSERVKMQRSYFFAGVEQVQLSTDEKTLRHALWNERIFFLLRMLVKAEFQRRTLIEMDFQNHMIDVTERRAQCHLQKPYTNTLTESISASFATQLADTTDNKETRTRQTNIQLKPMPETLLEIHQHKTCEEHYEDTSGSNHVTTLTNALPVTEDAAPIVEQHAEQWQELGPKSAAAIVPGGVEPVPKTATEDAAPIVEQHAEQWQELDSKSAAAIVPGGVEPVPKTATEDAAPIRRAAGAEQWQDWTPRAQQRSC
ncbi:hypothetical protein TraAM80_02382, partial [Trypanosoma rangeli]